MGCTQCLSILNEQLLVDFDHLVPMLVLLVELDKDLIRFDKSAVLDVTGVPACTIDAYVDLFSFVEMMRAMVADRQTHGNINCASPKMLRQRDCAGSRDNKLPDDRKRSLGNLDGF